MGRVDVKRQEGWCWAERVQDEGDYIWGGQGVELVPRAWSRFRTKGFGPTHYTITTLTKTLTMGL